MAEAFVLKFVVGDRKIDINLNYCIFYNVKNALRQLHIDQDVSYFQLLDNEGTPSSSKLFTLAELESNSKTTPYLLGGIFRIVLEPDWRTMECSSQEHNSMSPHFEVVVKTITGASLSILTRKWDTMDTIFCKIRDKIGVSPDHIRMIFAGKSLERGHVVGSLLINPLSVLHMVFRIPNDGFDVLIERPDDTSLGLLGVLSVPCWAEDRVSAIKSRVEWTTHLAAAKARGDGPPQHWGLDHPRLLSGEGQVLMCDGRVLDDALRLGECGVEGPCFMRLCSNDDCTLK